jgi:hypothetical protein
MSHSLPETLGQRRKAVSITFAVALACLVAAGCGSSSKSSSSSTTKAPSAPATTAAPATTVAPTTVAPTTVPTAKFVTFGDGTYTVGEKVVAGTYRAPGPSSLCYWERLSGFGGALDDIIANNTTGDPSVVTIAPTDKGFRTTGCGTWTSDLSAITTSKTSFGPGTYIVNTDITPGTYSAPGSDTCYWARLSGFGGSTSSIIANNFSSGSVVVTIAATDKGFESNGCGTFTKS